MRSFSPRLRASAALLVATAGVTALGALGTSAYAATPSDNARAESLAQQAYAAAGTGSTASSASTHTSNTGNTGSTGSTGYSSSSDHTAAALAQSAYSQTTGTHTTTGTTHTTTHTSSTQASTPTASTSYSGSAQSIAAQIVPAGQLAAFDQIISHESGWNVTATNPSSGAYGLAQSLPGDKMASAGSDWQTNPATQIKWALNYMDTTYGSPNQAWSFWQNNSWY
jgi:hypothetical protein